MAVKLRLRLEATPGDSIKSVATAMREAADRLGFVVDLKFNDVELVMSPGCDPDSLVEAFHIAGKRPEPRMAFATPK